MNFEVEKFNHIKQEAEAWYKNIEKAECPFLKRKVNFNVKGLKHIRFKAWNKSRPLIDQYLRLRFERSNSEFQYIFL